MAPDYVLYDYFKDKFEKKMDIFGRRKLEYESHILQGEIDRVSKQCATKSSSTKELCQLYTMADLKFVGFVRSDQKVRSLIKLMHESSS